MCMNTLSKKELNLEHTDSLNKTTLYDQTIKYQPVNMQEAQDKTVISDVFSSEEDDE